MAPRKGPLSSRRAALFVSLVLAADLAVASGTQNAAATTPAINLEFRPVKTVVDPENNALLAEAIERSTHEPTNPKAHYTVATYYWEKEFRDFTTSEALTYKNLLLRVQANLETDSARREALLREADALRDKAQEIRQKALAAAAD